MAQVKRSRKKATPQSIKTARRQAEALGYRVQGYTYERIGEALKCSTKHAWHLVHDGLAEIPAENAEQLRQVEAQRLDAMQINHFQNAIQGDINSTSMVLRIMERRARLLGLDAPTRTELTGKDGKDLPAPTIDAQTARSALVEALAKAGISDAPRNDQQPERTLQ